MGIRIQDLSERQRAMLEPSQASPEPVTPKPREGRSRLERDEQRTFAAWLSLHELPHCWHRTDKRSTATTGVFDFWVGHAGRSAWIEFKLSGGKLSPEQEQFKQRLIKQNLGWHIVTNANEAIRIVRSWQTYG
jgi:hypothetical protein